MKAVSRMFLGVVVVGSIGCLVVAARAQRAEGIRVRTVKGEGLYAALQEPVPQIVLHHAVFGRPIQIASAEPTGLDETGSPTRAPVVLKYASAGVVIGKDYRAVRVDIGDRVSVGDLIIGGVVENTGSTSVLVMYSGGGEVELDRGKRLYIGTKARILEPAGAEGGVAAPELVLTSDGFPLGGVAREGGPESALKPPTHCFQCQARCKGNGCSCIITVAAINNGCGGHHPGTKCKCGNTSGCAGFTGGFFPIYVPCEE